MYAIIIEQKDDLMHVGKGHDDNPPGRGSGRYPYGSGERPFQSEENASRSDSIVTEIVIDDLSSVDLKDLHENVIKTFGNPERVVKNGRESTLRQIGYNAINIIGVTGCFTIASMLDMPLVAVAAPLISMGLATIYDNMTLKH